MLNRFLLFVFAASAIDAASFSQADEMMRQSASPALQIVSIADDGTLKIPLTRIQAVTETRSFRVNVTKNHLEYRKSTSGGVEVVDMPHQVESESLVELKIPVFEQIEWSVSADKVRGFDTKGNVLSADQLKARFKTPAPAVVCPVGSVVPIKMLPLLSDAATILTIDDFEPGVIKDNNPAPPPSPPVPAASAAATKTVQAKASTPGTAKIVPAEEKAALSRQTDFELVTRLIMNRDRTDIVRQTAIAIASSLTNDDKRKEKLKAELHQVIDAQDTSDSLRGIALTTLLSLSNK